MDTVYVVTCTWALDPDLTETVVYGVYRNRIAARDAIGRVAVDVRANINAEAWRRLVSEASNDLAIFAKGKVYTYTITATPLEG
jgi:hypothetical protein